MCDRIVYAAPLVLSLTGLGLDPGLCDQLVGCNFERPTRVQQVTLQVHSRSNESSK